LLQAFEGEHACERNHNEGEESKRESDVQDLPDLVSLSLLYGMFGVHWVEHLRQ
jgi:hypothetical protein